MIYGLILFDNGDFVGGEVIEGVDEGINLLVGGGYLALEEGLFVAGLCCCETLIKFEHGLHESDHGIVLGYVVGVVEVNGADGKKFGVLPNPSIKSTTNTGGNRRKAVRQ